MTTATETMPRPALSRRMAQPQEEVHDAIDDRKGREQADEHRDRNARPQKRQNTQQETGGPSNDQPR